MLHSMVQFVGITQADQITVEKIAKQFSLDPNKSQLSVRMSYGAATLYGAADPSTIGDALFTLSTMSGISTVQDHTWGQA